MPSTIRVGKKYLQRLKRKLEVAVRDRDISVVLDTIRDIDLELERQEEMINAGKERPAKADD